MTPTQIKELGVKLWGIPAQFRQNFKDAPFAQHFRLNQPVSLMLSTWPMLWGFLAVKDSPLLTIPLTIALGLALRSAALIYSDLTEANIFIDEEGESPSWWVLALISGATLWIAAMLGAPTLLCLILWGLMVIGFPYLSKITWWPQMYSGFVFGAWPVLIGQTATGYAGFSVLPVMIAGMTWVAALETLRSGTDFDPNERLGIITQVLGDKKFDVTNILFGITLIFLILSGIMMQASGLFYGCIMLAQAVMTRAFFLEQLKEDDSKPYKATSIAAFCAVLGFLLS